MPALRSTLLFLRDKYGLRLTDPGRVREILAQSLGDELRRETGAGATEAAKVLAQHALELLALPWPSDDRKQRVRIIVIHPRESWATRLQSVLDEVSAAVDAPPFLMLWFPEGRMARQALARTEATLVLLAASVPDAERTLTRIRCPFPRSAVAVIHGKEEAELAVHWVLRGQADRLAGQDAVFTPAVLWGLLRQLLQCNDMQSRLHAHFPVPANKEAELETTAFQAWEQLSLPLRSLDRRCSKTLEQMLAEGCVVVETAQEALLNEAQTYLAASPALKDPSEDLRSSVVDAHRELIQHIAQCAAACGTLRSSAAIGLRELTPPPEEPAEDELGQI